MATPHYHKNEQGLLVRCYHNGKSVLCSGAFWIGVTISFPIEHLLWTKVPPFSWFSAWVGL